MNDAWLGVFGPQLCILRLGLSVDIEDQGLFKSIVVLKYPVGNGDEDVKWVRMGFYDMEVWISEESQIF